MVPDERGNNPMHFAALAENAEVGRSSYQEYIRCLQVFMYVCMHSCLYLWVCVIMWVNTVSSKWRAMVSGDRVLRAANARLLRRQCAAGGVPQRGWGDAAAASHERGHHARHSSASFVHRQHI